MLRTVPLGTTYLYPPISIGGHIVFTCHVVTTSYHRMLSPRDKGLIINELFAD
jgi:hypothetical protein